MILIRRPRTLQPTAPPSIDTSNPVTFGLVNALTFWPGCTHDAAKNRLVSTTAAFGTLSYGMVPGAGLGLYTNNGSAASIALNEDWSGPSTTLWQCVIKGVDGNYGGLWSKNSSGTQQQLGVGRNSTANTWYAGRADSGITTLTGTSISGVTDKVRTFAYTNASADVSAPIAWYEDGRFVVSTNYAATAQITGAGSLYLGCERSAVSGFDSDVYWTCFFRFNRVLNATEIAGVGNNPFSLFKGRRIAYVVTAAGIVTPTLTAASAINVTSTTARARVTFTRP